MKKNKFILIVWTLLFALVSGSMLTSCNDDDEGSSDTVILNSFGPSPALRGGELRFIGQNMSQVTSVVLPENIEVTSFTMATNEEVRILIPQEAQPGFVTLKTPKGDLTTKTKIDYSEPITITSYTPAKAKAGDVLTIDGDYLNLIKEVIFAENVSVTAENFISQTRKIIEVLIPANAQTGKVAVSTGAEIPIVVYTENAIEVVLPVISSIAPNPVKPGSQITITGTDFDLVKAIIFNENLKVEDYTVNDAFTGITVTVPVNAKDGKLKLLALSDVEVTSITDLTLILPTISSMLPGSVKNEGTLTIKGTNLDLVTAVTFGGGKVGTIVSTSAIELQVTVPIDAVTGAVILSTQSGKAVTGASITIIDPVFTSFSPTATKANGDVTITGTNLDLVTDVVFTGNIKGSITQQSETQLTITVPIGAQTGLITLTAKNGNQIMSPLGITILTNLPEFTSFTESSGVLGEILTINGTKMNLIKELIFPGNITATAYGTKNDTKIEVYVPVNTTKGYGQIRMITYEGEEGLLPEINFVKKGPEAIEKDSWVFFDFDASDASIGWNDLGASENEPTLSISGNYYHVNQTVDGSWKVYFARNWGKFSAEGIDPTKDAVKMDVNFLESVGPDVVLKFRMSATDGNSYWYVWKVGELFPQGTPGWLTVTLPLSGFLDHDGNGPGTISDVSLLGAEYGITSGWGAGKINMCVDNIRFGTN
ncbi:MAG TPA: glycan-binding surface protein [Prolixibacteraceae bacterium]|nr:glycan-binding surface protein [Prolixibacteraceae bacterium]